MDPKSQDHLELKKDLLEMVQLTRDLLGEASAAALSKTREAPPPPPPQQQQSSGSLHVASLRQPGQVTEFGGWRVGDKCQTVYLADGLSYPAVVTSFRPAARSALVTFVGYLNQQETPIELLVRVAGPWPVRRERCGMALTSSCLCREARCGACAPSCSTRGGAHRCGAQAQKGPRGAARHFAHR